MKSISIVIGTAGGPRCSANDGTTILSSQAVSVPATKNGSNLSPPVPLFSHLRFHLFHKMWWHDYTVRFEGQLFLVLRLSRIYRIMDRVSLKFEIWTLYPVLYHDDDIVLVSLSYGVVLVSRQCSTAEGLFVYSTATMTNKFWPFEAGKNKLLPLLSLPVSSLFQLAVDSGLISFPVYCLWIPFAGGLGPSMAILAHLAVSASRAFSGRGREDAQSCLREYELFMFRSAANGVAGVGVDIGRGADHNALLVPRCIIIPAVRVWVIVYSTVFGN